MKSLPRCRDFNDLLWLVGCVVYLGPMVFLAHQPPFEFTPGVPRASSNASILPRKLLRSPISGIPVAEQSAHDQFGPLSLLEVKMALREYDRRQEGVLVSAQTYRFALAPTVKSCGRT